MYNKALDFRFMLFEYYKELRINETELVIILFIEHLQQKETEFITPDLINLQSNIDIKVIDEAMVRLVSKGLIEFTTRNGKMVTSLNPLRNKLQELFVLDYEKNKENSTVEFSSQVEEVYAFIQNAFGRSLSAVELQTINDWFNYGYNITMIKEALDQTMKRKRYNIRAIDKALLKLSTAVDYALEGKSAQSDSYRKNIKDTLEEVNKKAQDDGISGTSTKRREGFNEMIKDALDGKIDLIITKSISRFARNTLDTISYTRKLKTKGIEVYFEKENLWSLDDKTEFLLTIMASMAQEESRSISQNVTMGKRWGMKEGRVSWAYSNMLGYKKENGKIVVIENEAILVRQIYQLFLREGKTGKTWFEAS